MITIYDVVCNNDLISLHCYSGMMTSATKNLFPFVFNDEPIFILQTECKFCIEINMYMYPLFYNLCMTLFFMK